MCMYLAEQFLSSLETLSSRKPQDPCVGSQKPNPSITAKELGTSAYGTF